VLEIAIPYRVETALERGIEGRGLAREDALSLMEEGPLEALLATASAVRDRFKGRSVSYPRKVFIPLTHLCRDYCSYCTFRADPQAGVQPYMMPDEVFAVAEAGCKEALFSMGDQPDQAGINDWGGMPAWDSCCASGWRFIRNSVRGRNS
jgi:FO synthase